MYEKNCFITLTYDNENLPQGETLVKRHWQLFMKSLRKEFGEGIRFFHCGEYGDEKERPHYHACLFNHDFPDKELWQVKNGNNLYTSEKLNKIWGKGYCIIGEVTFESAAYCARYIMKKITGEPAKEHYKGRLPEYILMSRGSQKLKTGGIGKKWFDKYKNDIYNYDMLVIRDGIKCRPNKYYDALFNKINPTKMKSITLKRKEKIKKTKTKKLDYILKRVKIAQIKLKKLNKGKTL